jgi:GNAT superfamily N-acetyltransferase
MRRADHDLAIDPATFADIDSLLALVGACVCHMRSQNIDQWDEAYPSHAIIKADVVAGSAFVARRGEDVVGVIVLDQHQEREYAAVPWLFVEEPVVVVHRLMVRPDVEGQGLARALMAFAERRACAAGYSSLRLDAFTGNPRAIRLYERLGYRFAGEVCFRKGIFRCFEKHLKQL